MRRRLRVHRPTRSVLLLFALLSGAGCGRTRCEDLVAEPNAGSYRGGGSLGEDRMLDVSLKATAKQVTLSYTARDGSRIKAFYRVAKKSKK
ncbi:MAG: hypothetical protein JWN48_4199 [Myxococcaceae bacterium]|nr:hypothetical protein [Myxococcaceae bacterium]